jgi:hypothetical protein
MHWRNQGAAGTEERARMQYMVPLACMHHIPLHQCFRNSLTPHEAMSERSQCVESSDASCPCCCGKCFLCPCTHSPALAAMLHLACLRSVHVQSPSFP